MSDGTDISPARQRLIDLTKRAIIEHRWIVVAAVLAEMSDVVDAAINSLSQEQLLAEGQR
jgi:hypothetical protein